MHVLLSDSAVELTTAELEKCSNFIARIDVKKNERLKTFRRSSPRGQPDDRLHKHLRRQYRNRFAKCRKSRRLNPDTLI